MPNALTDELTPEAKTELAAMFADLKRRYPPMRAGRAGRHAVMLLHRDRFAMRGILR